MNKIFLHCRKCNKRLIERLPNGGLRFMFGRRTDANGEDLNDPPVDILCYGTVIMKCLSNTCKATNTFTFFPDGSVFKLVNRKDPNNK